MYISTCIYLISPFYFHAVQTRVLIRHFLPLANEVWGKVMFLQVSVWLTDPMFLLSNPINLNEYSRVIKQQGQAVDNNLAA